MKQVKKIGSFLQNCVELYIPAISFAVLFVLFCFQIVVRYIISKFTGLVVPWTVEVEQMCFLWVALLGACYVQRSRGHVVFTLVYDALGTKGKAVLSLISSTLISFACACLPRSDFASASSASASADVSSHNSSVAGGILTALTASVRRWVSVSK